MFADIHSHRFPPANRLTVCNITVNQTNIVINSDFEGSFSAGLHPCFFENFSENTFNKLSDLAKSKNIIAIGECGLDKFSDGNLSEQIFYFEKQIALSENLKKPLIIHCVGRFNELIAIKKSLKPQQKWIIHGFRGKPQLAENLLNTGFSLSFGENFNPDSIKLVPLENLFVETDESQMPIGKIYEKIATVKGCNIDDITAGINLVMNYELMNFNLKSKI